MTFIPNLLDLFFVGLIIGFVITLLAVATLIAVSRGMWR